METVVVLFVTHDKPVVNLKQLVAGRAWTIEGVRCVEIVQDSEPLPALFAESVLDSMIPTRTPSYAGDSQWSWTGNAAV